MLSECCDIFEIHNAAYERHAEMYRNIQLISLILYACVWILIAGCLCKYDMNLYGTLSVDEAARCRSYRD